jgi:hypothetical protein
MDQVSEKETLGDLIANDDAYMWYILYIYMCSLVW